MSDEAILRIVLQETGGAGINREQPGAVPTGSGGGPQSPTDQAAPEPRPDPSPSRPQPVPVPTQHTPTPAPEHHTASVPTPNDVSPPDSAARDTGPNQGAANTGNNPPQQRTAPPESLVGVPPHLQAIHQVFMQSLDDLDAAEDALKALGFAARDIARVRQDIENAPQQRTDDSSTKRPKAKTTDAFDPRDEAIRRHEAEQRRKQIEEAYKDIYGHVLEEVKPEPRFDPVAEAEKRRDAERRRAQVDAAYEDRYGREKKKSGMDEFLEVADSLRGLIGGMFGPVIGAVLDVATGMRNAEVEAEQERSKKELLEEARGRNVEPSDQSTSRPPAPAQPAPTPAPTPAPDTPAPEQPAPAQPAPTQPTHPAPAPAPGPKPAPAAGGDPSVTKPASAAPEAAEAEGAVSGVSGAVAADGPIGLAVATAMEVEKAIKDTIRQGIGVAANAANVIASPSADPAEPIAKLGEAASVAGEKLGGFGEGLFIVGESMKALSSIMNSLDQTANRYSEFSPEITQAQAIAEVRQTMGDFRRAQEVSGEMVKYIMAQSDLQQKFEDIKVRLLTKMLPAITQALAMIEVIVATGEGTAKAIEVLAAPLTAIASVAAEMLGIQQDDRMPDVKDPTEQLFNPRFFETPAVDGWTPDR